MQGYETEVYDTYGLAFTCNDLVLQIAITSCKN